MKLRYLLVLLSISSMQVQAEIYKSVDKDGHVTYSSTPTKGSKKIELEPLPTMVPPARPRSAESPEGFPKVDGATQKGRDETRRRILEDELAAEQKLLEDARQNLKTGEENPEVFRTKDGKTSRNVAKYDEKVKKLNAQVELHQKNVEALKTELSNLR